jgi:hypothetical protein
MLFRAARDLEAPPVLPARFFRSAQNGFLIFDLRLELLDTAFEPVAFRDPVLELLMLAVHDQLRFCPVATERLELLHSLGQRVDDQLRFRSVLEERFNLALQVRDRSGLVIHDLLDLGTIRQKRVKPDLADFQGRLGLFRHGGSTESIDARRGERVHFHQILDFVGPPKKLL